MRGTPPYTKRQTIHDLPMIDIHRLRREGTHATGGTTTTVMVNGIEHVIPLALRPGTLGGEVTLFVCSHCGRKRWHLYCSRDGELACRRCLKLGYPGNLVRRGSLLSRVRRLRRRLGGDSRPLAALPPRKGRRGWSALWYDKLVAEITIAEAQAINMLGVLNDQIGREINRDQANRHKRKHPPR
jgi:hypothetical protein